MLDTQATLPPSRLAARAPLYPPVPDLHRPIVLASDQTGSDAFPLRYAQALAREQHTDLIFVHTLDPVLCEIFDGSDPSLQEPAAQKEWTRLQHDALARVHSSAEADPLLEEILSVAQLNHCSMLVIGTHGHSHAARMALARRARQLLLIAPCPVLVVGMAEERSLKQAGKWRRVLAATDFSASAIAALRYAHSLANQELIALHCAACGNTEACSKCLERLRLLAPFNESHTVPVRHIVESGDSAELIISHAYTQRADLVVLGPPALAQTQPSQPSTSTVCQVIEGVECPVLLVPQKARATPDEVIRNVVFA